MLKNKQAFWKNKWNKTCGITRSRLRPGKNKYGISYSVFLNCNHGFYRNALIEWIKNCPSENPTCPMCRKIIEVNSILDVL